MVENVLSNISELRQLVKAVIILSVTVMLTVLTGCTNRDNIEMKSELKTESDIYQESEDIDKLDIGKRIEERSQLSIEDALQGMWIEENGTIVRFTDEYFMQGEKLEHAFRFEMKEKTENELQMSLFGVEGFMIRDRNLFELNVVMDETRTQMIMRKDIGGSEYVYYMVYLDAEGIELSPFDTLFLNNGN